MEGLLHRACAALAAPTLITPSSFPPSAGDATSAEFKRLEAAEAANKITKEDAEKLKE